MQSFNETVRGYLKPVLPFLDDPAVTEIMINGPAEVWVEKGGKLFLTRAAFTEEGLTAAAKNIAQFVGRILSDERPRLDARLPDGSRIHVILPPVSRKGTCIAIRKFFPRTLTMDDLTGFGTLDGEMAAFLDRVVRAKITVIVAGGTSSGKTTLLNILARAIPDNERVVTIEDAAELRIEKPHVVPLESRPPDAQGKGAVSIRDLLHSSLRLRPDRIIIGEVRGPEAFDLVQALNTGHGGSMCTTHANTPVGALRRIESLCLMSEVDLPLTAVRAQVASAIDLVVCCSRLLDGSRKITHVAEVLPLDEKGDYRTQDLYLHTVVGRSPDGSIMGSFTCTQVEPVFAPRLKAIEVMGVAPAPDAAKPTADLAPGRPAPKPSEPPQPFAQLLAQAGETTSKGPAPLPKPAPEKPRSFVKPQPHMSARAQSQTQAPEDRFGGAEVEDADPAEVLAIVDQAEEIEPEPQPPASPDRTAVTRKPPPPRRP